MRYAGFLSFLEKFIFVPNQSNQVWRLRLLIMAVAVRILFYPDDLCEAKRIQRPLDSHLPDFCYAHLPKVNYAGFNNHQISPPEYHPIMVERVVHLTFVFTESGSFFTEYNFTKYNFSVSVFTESGPFVLNSGPVFNKWQSYIQVSPPSRTNHQVSQPEHNTGVGESVIGIVLGPNRSDPVWQLRLLAAFSLVVHATMGVLFLPRDLQGVPATYRWVMLIMSFAAPIVIAVITLLISLWVEPDRDGDSNWITGLSVANFSTLGGRLAVYWAFKRET